MLGKNKKTPTSAAKSGQNQRTITSFFAKPNATTPARAVGPSASQSLGQPEPHPHPQQQQQQQLPSAQPQQQPPSIQTTTAQSLPPRESDKMDEDHDDDNDNDAPVLAKKRSKFVVADDDSDDDAAKVETLKKRKTNDDDDEDKDKFNSDAMKTPARKSLDKFASPRFDFVQKTPASSSSQVQYLGNPFLGYGIHSCLRFKANSLDFNRQKAARAMDFKERNQDRYAFLLDERDADKNRPGEPSYDPRTLYIPPSAWSKFTPFEHQFWEIKSKHWDTVDADVASKEFDWKCTDRVNMKMCGVPENSFDHWASQFVARGYKVAKVDQVENAIAKDMAKKKNGPSGNKKEDSVIRRELTMILTAGTLVDTQLLTSEMSTYCMAIKEEVNAGDSAEPLFGVSFVDTSTAEFNISYFRDDADRTHLETLLLQLKPKELVLEKGCLSAKTQKVLKNCLNDPQCNHLIPEVEYWTVEATLDELQRPCYFGVAGEGGAVEVKYPDAVNRIRDEPLAMASLGGLLSYLRSLKLDKDLVSARNFQIYDPLRRSGNLILDGQTLLNLEVFENTSDGSSEGTLFKLLNHCVTPSGKRLFKTWVCHPLQDIAAINSRLDAVDDISGCPDFQDEVTTCFRKLPDLERIISRIHAGTSRVKDFMLVLKGFTDIFNLMVDVQKFAENFKSTRLVQLLTTTDAQHLRDELKFFEEAFDHSEGLNTTEINANAGFDDVYDEAAAQLEGIADEFESYRKEKERSLGVKCGYKDLGKDLYQLEIPTWIVQTKTQAVTRYYTPETKAMLERYLEAREERGQALKNVRARMFARFDEHYLRHPCIHTESGKEFIPNDTVLGGEGGSTMILLTGPNMGGKSTLLRQTCIAVIMAQLGCYVPAATCRLTPFERIFTRIGAHDNILAGQSTFMVELSETSKILREATPRSLVILDELGRGTSTFDGFAIAFSVLYQLITQTKCLGLFSTHYGMLTKEFEDNGLVSLKHMSFVADEEKHSITFLYKLTDGACPKSFGMNVALMAGVPSSIVDTAERVASEFESKLKMTRTTG
ncbi:hypothetical protein BCR33DRAFT_753229 [Rhizoclosmatium globosum]|uniref:DNA mismatch repair proteins mutS family domain-containing protein n=1 Tax=Rhizoclosmatium globosum TaxID=329046 RepID=A0A1Y2CQ25_9FUNG|nr:hypothetical protein BCR33DRAFT_753229 [Rhizoclosmatium globosum]|eukprot:ORY49140.1 hypothetical protein BCR33DRAFT_753229 [Rhizoclosmatium globosum]